MRALCTTAVLGLLFVPPALAGDPYSQGNGVGKAYIATTQAIIGGTFVVDAGTTATTFAPSTILSISDGIGPSNSLIGPICLEVSSPAYFFAAYPLDVNGNFHLEVSVPNIPALVGAPPIFANALTVEVDGGPAFISLSKTVRFQWELSDSYRAIGPMSAPRAMHTATALGVGSQDDETRVLIVGGGDGNFIFPAPLASTELYHPLTRAFTPGPDLAEPRMTHRSVRLPDGRVLVAGGVTTGGVVLASCEIYDPATNTFVPTGTMNAPRSAHALTLLPNARVLASGGFADWQSPATQFVALLNGAQRSAELYDPATGTWTPIADMADDRAGHSQTLLPSGQVLILSGINGGASDLWGGQVPTFTASCEIYDPFLDQFTATAPTSIDVLGFPAPFARGFHGASLLPNGDVLVTGGMVAGGFQQGATASNACYVWSASAGTWSATGSLVIGVAFHTQVASGAGGAHVNGGHIQQFTQLAASSQSGHHDGTTYVDGAQVGTHPVLAPLSAQLGNHTITRLFDGTFLVAGGAHSPTLNVETRAEAFIYVP